MVEEEELMSRGANANGNGCHGYHAVATPWRPWGHILTQNNNNIKRGRERGRGEKEEGQLDLPVQNSSSLDRKL